MKNFLTGFMTSTWFFLFVIGRFEANEYPLQYFLSSFLIGLCALLLVSLSTDKEERKAYGLGLLITVIISATVVISEWSLAETLSPWAVSGSFIKYAIGIFAFGSVFPAVFFALFDRFKRNAQPEEN